MMSKKTKFFWVFISALLAIFSHPMVLGKSDFSNGGFLAFIAYLPLLYFVFQAGEKKPFRLVFLFGILFYLGTLHWLYIALNGYGHLHPLLSVGVLFILVLILATYFTGIFAFSYWMERKLSISHFWTLPLFWVSLEWLRTHWPLGGFPWAQAGYSQWKYLTFIQVADLVGVYGVTALLIWINLAVLEIISFIQKKEGRQKAALKIFFVLLLVLATLIYGVKQKTKVDEISLKAPHFNLALLQGNIPQDEKWLLEKSDEILRIYQEMTHQAFSEQKISLVIWPEAAFPYEVALDEEEDLEAMGSYPGDLLLGAVSYENKGRLPASTLYTPLDFPVHNSALLIKPGSKLGGAYFKHHLVPYGEYIPLKSVIPFLGKVTGQMGEFLQGTEYNLLESGAARMGMLICYEDIFPEIAQRLVKAGANMLVNLTNDAWYGDSSALPQHLSFSAFRAIENRRSLVRATNTGISASFDASGNIWQRAPVFERKIIYDQIPLLTLSSFYAQWGDLFSYTCLAFSILLVLIASTRHFLKKK